MEQSNHCVLCGEGAHLFAEKNGIKLIDNQELVHQNALNQLARYKTIAMKTDDANSRAENQILTGNEQNKMTKMNDTVGAVAMDYLGNLACSNSTGGQTCKGNFIKLVILA